MQAPNLNSSRITGQLDGLIIDGEPIALDEPVSSDLVEYWMTTRFTDPGISLIKASTAKSKAPVNPLAPVQIPEV
jgi:hypothetical protein